jgi:hypothetical protein
MWIFAHDWNQRFRVPLRVTVRSLAVAILGVALGMSWLVWNAKAQRDAVAAVRAVGGRVFYGAEWARKTPGAGPSETRAGWIEHILGVDYVDTPEVVILNLDNASLDLSWVGRLSHLKALILSGRGVTDAGLAPVSRLSGLRELALFSTFVTDTGLSHIEGLTDLRSLQLSGLPITSSGLAHLRGLSRLQNLELDRTCVTDEGLFHLSKLCALLTLDLTGTQVTDRGLAHLRGLAQLTTLHLHGTRVGDAGLTDLGELHRLRLVSLGNTAVSDAGEERLRWMLPNLTIVRHSGGNGLQLLLP